MIHMETGGQRFGLCIDQALVGVFVEGDIAVFGRFSLLELLAGLAALGLQFQVLDDVFWRLGHHVSNVVKTLSTGPTCNLVKITCSENRRLVAAVFAKLSKKNGANGNVHAYAQSIGAADDFQ